MNVSRAMDILANTLGVGGCSKCEVKYQCIKIRKKTNITFCEIEEVMNTEISKEEQAEMVR